MCVPAVLASGEDLHVYSHRHYPLDRELYGQFTDATGIRVRVLQGGADELIERIHAEGARSPADVLITVDAARLARARERGILQAVTSEVLRAQVPAELRDDDGYWYALTVRLRVIVYNPDALGGRSVATYAGLAGPEWRGGVAVRTSRHTYNIALLSSLIDEHGTGFARQWVDGVAGNLARNPQGNDRDQMRAVALGQAGAALVNSYYLGLFLSSGGRDRDLAGNLAISFPDQGGRGAHANISGAGVVGTSQNRGAAVRLLEFLSSPAVQAQYARGNYEYPVHAGVAPPPIVAAWGDPKINYGAIKRLHLHWQEAVRIFDRSAWK